VSLVVGNSVLSIAVSLRAGVLSGRDGIDEGHNEADEPAGSEEIVRVSISGRYRHDRLDGAL